MSFRDELRAEPERFDLFAVLRELERSAPKKPRIGDSSIIAEEVVDLGQEPFLEFPASNLTRYQDTPSGTPRLKTRFLGFFGPQGALPLTTTVEAYGWLRQRDDSFTRFTDILAGRFQQLFYRAWADARPIAQHDRPADDRFLRYLGALTGIGTEPYLKRDSVDDLAKIGFAGLTGSLVKSASRLRQLIRGVFGVNVEVVERIGTWLAFEPDDRMALGAPGASLGVDTFLGERSYSINDRIRICIQTNTLDEYRDFLPSGEKSQKLADLVFYYLGHRFEFDIELALPARLAPPTRLGQSGELGWTSWVAPAPADAAGEGYLTDTRFDPMERKRAAEASARGATRRAAKSSGGRSK